jgi:hypothetical protein
VAEEGAADGDGDHGVREVEHKSEFGSTAGEGAWRGESGYSDHIQEQRELDRVEDPGRGSIIRPLRRHLTLSRVLARTAEQCSPLSGKS